MRTLLLSYALVGSLAVLMTLLSSVIRRLPVSEPLLALILGVVVGPAAGLVDVPGGDVFGLTREISRALLAISLMAVALRFPLAEYRSVIRPVGLLLALGIVGMAVATAGLAWLILPIPLALAALIGACLTPTDPVLASSIVSGKPAEHDLPARLRATISGESGGNDGLAYPFVVLALVGVTSLTAGEQVLEAVRAVGGAVIVGVAVGFVAGVAVRAAMRRETVDSGSLLIFSLVLSITALGVARMAYVDGILAVFVTGLAYNATVGQGSRASQQKLDDSLTRYLVLPLFFLLGIETPWRDWLDMGWPALAFPAAVVLLRRLPVVLALRPALGMGWRDALFLGWFGPIGVSALFYLTYSHEEGATDPRIWVAGTLVIAASTVVHGITATPGRRIYAGKPLMGAE